MPKRLTRHLSFDALRAASRPDGMPQAAIAVGAFAAAGGVAVLAAWLSSLAIEARSEEAVRSRLLGAGITWATASADGLQLHLTGTAPNEAARFRAVNLAGSVIDAARVRDNLEVTPVKAVEAPKFSVEMLRNDDGVQLIGLLPAGDAEERLKTAANAVSAGSVLDMIEIADYPPPENWAPAFAYGIEALRMLPRSKVSISAGRVTVTAIADSAAEQRRLEAELNRARPRDLGVRVDISAPRPVITPFTLRFVLDDQGPRFDACSADTDRARIRILAAGTSAGVTGTTDCTIGLGVPSPSWAEAVSQAISAVKTLGAATVTFADADVTLEAASSVSQADFDHVVGELQNSLPEVFSLTATLERRANGAQEGPAEFTATLNADGSVELRGRLTDTLLRDAVDSFAKARFGVGKVLTATRLDGELPDGWPVRVLAGLESLGELAEGRLVVRADTVDIQGVTGSQAARGRISQILSGQLGQGQTFKVAVRYDEKLDPLAALPTPQECITGVTGLLQTRKIAFSPGSAEIDGQSAGIMDDLAELLEECPNVQMEIGGHTDSQGSDEGNRALSQARAEAVLLSLQGRGVNIGAITAKGYGEATPIADNATEAGREANRRIEFTLVGQPAPAAATPVDTTPQDDAPQDDTTAPAAAPPEASAATPPAAVENTAEPAGTDTTATTDDDSPSVAPTEKTRRPVARPARDG